MSAILKALAVAVTAAGVAALSAASRTSYETGAEGALLRLSWRVRGEEIERCRRATKEELESVPAHMRQEVICEGRRVAPYRLRLAVDGRALLDQRAPGSDVAGDRPMFLLRDVPLAPGAHRVAVRLERLGEGEASDTLQRREARRRAIPPRLALDTTVTIGAQGIALVTYDSELERLVLLAPGRE